MGDPAPFWAVLSSALRFAACGPSAERKVLLSYLFAALKGPLFHLRAFASAEIVNSPGFLGGRAAIHRRVKANEKKNSLLPQAGVPDMRDFRMAGWRCARSRRRSALDRFPPFAKNAKDGAPSVSRGTEPRAKFSTREAWATRPPSSSTWQNANQDGLSGISFRRGPASARAASRRCLP